MFIPVHVILSDKILRSYCLNDKNLTNNLGSQDIDVPRGRQITLKFFLKMMKRRRRRRMKMHNLHPKKKGIKQ